jgi:hypothetical protein
MLVNPANQAVYRATMYTNVVNGHLTVQLDPEAEDLLDDENLQLWYDFKSNNFSKKETKPITLRFIHPQISAFSEQNVGGEANKPLSKPLEVLVSDQFNRPLRDVNVSWTVSAGSGTLSTSQVKSNSDGIARVNYTLDGINADQEVRASAKNAQGEFLSGSPVIFKIKKVNPWFTKMLGTWTTTKYWVYDALSYQGIVRGYENRDRNLYPNVWSDYPLGNNTVRSGSYYEVKFEPDFTYSAITIHWLYGRMPNNMVRGTWSITDNGDLKAGWHELDGKVSETSSGLKLILTPCSSCSQVVSIHALLAR